MNDKIREAFELLVKLLAEQREENNSDDCEFSVAWDDVMLEYDLTDQEEKDVKDLYDFTDH
jgi:hypothetical protein